MHNCEMIAMLLDHVLSVGFGGKRGVRSAECGKCGVWKMRGVENAECGKCGVWKMSRKFQFSISI